MELVNITYSGEGKQPVELTPQDQQLVTSNFINSSFGASNDYMELFIYDESGQLLDQDYDAFDYYPFLLNNPQNNTYSALNLDPERDLKNRGFNRGRLNTQYNFYRKLFNSQFGTFYWIKEISTSRTELKLASQVLPNTSIRDGFAQYQAYITTKNYYPVFYLNFGNNQLVTANNVAYTEDDQGGYLLVKLYEPLPVDFDVKSQLWLIDKVAESVSFDVDIQVQIDVTEDLNRLRGPNFNVRVNSRNGQTTPYYNYNNLLTSPISSSFQKLSSYYQDRAIEINVDYSSFNNFVHWSSAVERVNNFVYKLQLIESASADITAQKNIVQGGTNAPIVTASVAILQSQIDNIVKNFDPYEYFLYFDSSSFAWPKSTSTQPYQLYSVTSSQASSFIGSETTIPSAGTQSLLWSASYHDTTNKDILHGSAPQYLLDDPANQPYITFLDMVGQHFDNIWIYYKDVSNRFNAVNNPDKGISLDLVSDALRGLGFNLYTNSNVSDNLYYTLFGINPDGSLLPPTGSEIITNYVTSSLTTLPAQTIQDELYKRLYHNLPYLLKTKGTERGVKALVATYGIPDGILTVREFGGNPDTTTDGIYDLNTSDYKVTIATGSNGNVTGSLTLSSSLLSPYTTIQYYNENNRLNSKTVEVGFSTADIINQNITASQGYFDIDQLIGKPSDQYSSSYENLVSASNAYFTTYTQPNSIWEYIRLLKFYNNTIFKTIKDFIPARSNISTGIIVKSHLYERNKYARNEPSMSFQDYSQSIDMVEVSGSDGGALSGSTYWDGFVLTPIGLASYTSSRGIERFNGELSGSKIEVTNGQAFDQDEWSSLPGTGSGFIEVSLGATYQNISTSVKSQTLLDLDYNSDQLKPVNYNAVTYSISESQVNNYAAYTNPNNPFAQVQDYNYNLKRSIVPRYSGSQTYSATYNTWTPGDSSYGKTAAIDKIKYQYAYLIDVYTSSLFLPGRSNAQIKYLIDNNENVLDLTKANKNLFSVQNIYKGGQTANISLFDYDESNPYVQQLLNSPDTDIAEGGFRYLPILHNVSGSAQPQTYTLNSPVDVEIQVGGPGGGIDQNNPVFNTSNWSITWWSEETNVDGIQSRYDIYVSASYNSTVPTDVSVTVKTPMQPDTTCNSSPGFIRDISILVSSGGTSAGQGIATIYQAYQNGNGSSAGAGSIHWPSGVVACEPTYIHAISQIGSGGGGGGGTTTAIYYTTEVTSSNPCIYFISESNQLVFNSTLAFYSASNGITFKSTSDPSWSTSTLDPVIFPFTLSTGDRISFYDSASRLGWNENSEYIIKSTSVTGSGETGSAILVDVDRTINLALFSSGSTVPIENVTGARWRSCRYIVWKHIADETNVILRYSPKDNNIQEIGILFPEYIDPEVRDNAGNVIKSLKQQNLIDSSRYNFLVE
jgi:hypothetical protein